jgi:hypothetical protein
MQFLNPYDLIHVNDVALLSLSEIMKEKRKILLQFELNNEPFIDFNGLKLSKDQVLKSFEELENETLRELYLILFNDKELNKFLTFQNIDFYLKYKENQHHSNQKLIELIAPYFVQIFDDFILKLYEERNVKMFYRFVNHNLLKNTIHEELCYEKINKKLQFIVDEIKSENEKLSSNPSTSKTLKLIETLNHQLKIGLINALPESFQEYRNDLGHSLLFISFEIWINLKNKDSIRKLMAVACNLKTTGAVHDQIHRYKNLGNESYQLHIDLVNGIYHIQLSPKANYEVEDNNSGESNSMGFWGYLIFFVLMLVFRLSCSDNNRSDNKWNNSIDNYTNYSNNFNNNIGIDYKYDTKAIEEMKQSLKILDPKIMKSVDISNILLKHVGTDSLSPFGTDENLMKIYINRPAYFSLIFKNMISFKTAVSDTLSKWRIEKKIDENDSVYLVDRMAQITNTLPSNGSIAYFETTLKASILYEMYKLLEKRFIENQQNQNNKSQKNSNIEIIKNNMISSDSVANSTDSIKKMDNLAPKFNNDTILKSDSLTPNY